ncbi:MAG: hypothetical protein LBS48_00605 [Treponema sp.]|nr:hypothetical protein [Treponema sp.]
MYVDYAQVRTGFNVRAEASAGFFGGNCDGEQGQYRDNGYIKAVLTYSF